MLETTRHCTFEVRDEALYSLTHICGVVHSNIY